MLNRREFLRISAGAVAGIFAQNLEFSKVFAEEAEKVIQCPMLMYHEVANRDVFARQIRQKLEDGYSPINIDQAIDILKGINPGSSDKFFIITFDDGRLSPFLNAFPFLYGWKIPATFFVMPDWPGDGSNRYMDNNQLRELVTAGMRIESHGFSHQSLPLLRISNPEQWRADVVDSKARLEEIIGGGYKVRAFAYPYGQSDPQTRDLVSQIYDAGVTSRPGVQGEIQKSSNLFAMPRIRMS